MLLNLFWQYSICITGAEALLMLSVFLWWHFKRGKALHLYGGAVVCFFAVVVAVFALNVPITDDNYALLQWAVNYVPSRDFGVLVKGIFEPYNECRIVFARVVALIDLYFTGSVHFNHLMYVASTGLLLIAGLFLLQTRRSTRLSLAILFLLFQFQYYDSVFWANSALQNIWSVAFGMLSIYCLVKSHLRYFVFAIMAAIAASFTYGNGLFVWPIVLGYSLYKRNYKHLMLSTAICLGILAIYFHHFTPAVSDMSLVKRMGLAVPFTVVLLGGSFQFLYQIYLPMMGGIFILFSFFWMIRVGYYARYPFVFLVLLYLLLCAFTAGVFRGNRGAAEGLSVRYGIYAITAFISCLIFWGNEYLGKKSKGHSALLALAICYHFAANFFFFPEVMVRNDKLKRYVNSLPDKSADWYMSPVIPFESRTIVKEAIKKGLYCPPEL